MKWRKLSLSCFSTLKLCVRHEMKFSSFFLQYWKHIFIAFFLLPTRKLSFKEFMWILIEIALNLPPSNRITMKFLFNLHKKRTKTISIALFELQLHDDVEHDRRRSVSRGNISKLISLKSLNPISGLQCDICWLSAVTALIPTTTIPRSHLPSGMF